MNFDVHTYRQLEGHFTKWASYLSFYQIFQFANDFHFSHAIPKMNNFYDMFFPVLKNRAIENCI